MIKTSVWLVAVLLTGACASRPIAWRLARSPAG
jgi:hypothetical protein